MFRGPDFILMLSICSARLTKCLPGSLPSVSVLDPPCVPLGFRVHFVVDGAVECATLMLQIPFAPSGTLVEGAVECATSMLQIPFAPSGTFTCTLPLLIQGAHARTE
jgi:hypothetical protein